MALNPGDTLNNDHYRIIRQLGRGGFGFVYLAQDTLLSEQVAIKELIPALVGDESMLKRFLAEARATMRLRHERIVGTHNVFSEGGNGRDRHLYIVMEYMTGDSLEARLRERGCLPVAEATQVTSDLCEGLEYAHRRGVVHCDLKPANVLFDAAGTAKVADFGIAHISGEALTRSWMTPAGFVAGTLPYMSPEQADGVRDDPRIDVYALGAILYRMLTGQTYLEFDQRETPGATADNVYRLRREMPVPPSVHNRAVPVAVDQVVLKALAKRPEERYADVRTMGAALLQQQPVPAATVSPPPPSPTKLIPAHQHAGTTPPAPRQKPSPLAAGAAPAVKRASSLPVWFWPAVGAAAVLLVFLIIAIAALSRGGDRGAVAGAGTATDAGPAETTVAAPSATTTAKPDIMLTDTTVPTMTPTDTLRPTATLTSMPTDTPEPTATPTNTPIPPTNTPEAGATRTRDRDGTIMVYVPAGEFMMGSADSDGEANDDEKPQHIVHLDGFWVDRTEVTNARYQKCVDAGACGVANMPSYDPWGMPSHPVVEVTWDDAQAYCRWTGARLPTEAEWEKAARGTDGRKYPWGDSTADCSKAQYSGCGTRTVLVGSKAAGTSPYGAMDMAGNVWEWVSDRYDSAYYYNSQSKNPRGPDSGQSRVLRGGSWDVDWPGVRAANRTDNAPSVRDNDVGFRCAAD